MPRAVRAVERLGPGPGLSDEKRTAIIDPPARQFVAGPHVFAVAPDEQRQLQCGPRPQIGPILADVAAGIGCGQKPWWCCVKKARERHAVREMKEDPSEPFCRGGLQTAMSCFGQKLR